MAKMLIERRAQLDMQRTDTKRTALILAARNGSVPCVDLLLNAKADATIADREGLTPLLSAARFGHAGVIERLVKAQGKGSLEHSNQLDETPILLAAMYGHVAALRTLLLLGATADARDSKGRTPLMWVCLRDHEPLLPYFLVDGAPLDAVDDEGYSALMICSKAGHVGAAEMLVLAKADLLARGPGGLNALMFACRSGETGPDLVDVFIHASRGLQPARRRESRKRRGQQSSSSTRGSI